MTFAKHDYLHGDSVYITIVNMQTLQARKVVYFCVSNNAYLFTKNDNVVR